MSEAVSIVKAEAQESGQAELSELEGVASQAAYDAYVAAARTVDPAALEECCADLVLTYQTVTRGVESVLGAGAVVVGKLPNVNVVELSMLPRLVQAVAYAALQVQRELKSNSFGLLFERAQEVRRKLRKTADALAEAGLFPDADVDEVRLQGQQDVLEDCQALAALFRRNEARIAGRSPVTPGDVSEAEQLVGKLRLMLGQPGEEPGTDGQPPLLRSIEMRDRLWTLLSQRYDVLWRCGAWLYGRVVDERVPPLPVRQAMVRKAYKSATVERELPRRASEARRTLGPPAIAPARVSPPAMSSRDSNRHLADLQRELERKTRFLVKIGVIPRPD
jgi:hypothetical protein